MSSIDQQFIIVSESLVGNPDAVQVARSVDEKGVLLELTVDPEDLGRVIGKNAVHCTEPAKLAPCTGTKNDARYNLKIVDVDRPEGERDQPRPKAAPAAVTSNDDDDQPVDDSTPETVEKESDMAARTRKELADMDDLDI